MATYYRWRQSQIQYTESTSTSSAFSWPNPGSRITYYYSSAKPSIENGKYSFLSSKTSVGSQTLSGNYVAPYSSSDFVFYKYTSNYLFLKSGNTSIEGLEGSKQIQKIQISSPSPGTLVGYVYSTSSSAYPNGGVSGSYYYDQRTTVTSPTAPTGLTYPNPITTPTVTVSWDAATSNVPGVTVQKYRVYTYYNGSSVARPTVEETTSTNVQGYVPAIYDGVPVSNVKFSVVAIDSNGQISSACVGNVVPVYFSPNLTVPSLAMQGQPITVNWTSITGATSYTLQRKANTDADWTQVYSGANLSYSETVGTWTSVQYRVQAVFDGTPGGWAESAAIPVVSSSALVISGTDGDLGTVVNDIPYSISTDTGNQITATITVNSAVIFSGNVGNSTSDVIPVLDLVNGTGTIVIEASVQASGGPVSAVRTWTYTKTPITFPNAGSVAQLTKEGENIFPKTLAECVRLPGGKTLDQVMGFPCQIYAGSYVGTGTSGSSNPNTLTFGFEPKILFVSKQDQNFNSVGFFMLACKGVTNAQCMHAAQDTAPQGPFCALNWSENSVSWYNTSGATEQLNVNNETYFYVAIG